MNIDHDDPIIIKLNASHYIIIGILSFLMGFIPLFILIRLLSFTFDITSIDNPYPLIFFCFLWIFLAILLTLSISSITPIQIKNNQLIFPNDIFSKIRNKFISININEIVSLEIFFSEKKRINHIIISTSRINDKYYLDSLYVAPDKQLLLIQALTKKNSSIIIKTNELKNGEHLDHD